MRASELQLTEWADKNGLGKKVREGMLTVKPMPETGKQRYSCNSSAKS